MKTFVQRWQKSSANNYLVFALRLVVGLIFVLAGLSKATAPLAEFIALAKQWAILPDPWVTIYAFMLPWVELVAGALLLVGAWHRLAAGAIAVMLVSFLIAIGINLQRGVALENCGCFGEWIKLGETMQDLLWRDALMLLATLWIAAMPAPLRWSVDGWFQKR